MSQSSPWGEYNPKIAGGLQKIPHTWLPLNFLQESQCSFPKLLLWPHPGPQTEGLQIQEIPSFLIKKMMLSHSFTSPGNTHFPNNTSCPISEAYPPSKFACFAAQTPVIPHWSLVELSHLMGLKPNNTSEMSYLSPQCLLPGNFKMPAWLTSTTKGDPQWCIRITQALVTQSHPSWKRV